jgi:oligopeptide transport system ATP-binding protein
MSPLLEVADLRTHFFTPDGVVKAVNGVSFTLDEGEALGLVGESGCGKSVSALTLVRLIPQPPGRIVSGQVNFQGRDLLKLQEHEMRKVRGNDMAMIFQDPMTSLNPVLSIGRQIGEAVELHKGLDRAASRKRTIELLELVGIPAARSRVDDYPHQFSGGMRQRVMIAMALSCEPKLLIADEPTTALDVTIQAQILELIKRLREELGMAIIMITHDLGVVAGIADRINVMYAGHIVETGTVDELFHNPRHPYTLGLLNSIPRLDEPRKEKLVPIEGLPPDLVNPPTGCAFQPRCPYAVKRCAFESPTLEPVAPGHRIACWVDVATPIAQAA